MRNIGFFLSLCRGKAEDPAVRRWEFRNKEEKIQGLHQIVVLEDKAALSSAEIMRENKKTETGAGLEPVGFPYKKNQRE